MREIPVRMALKPCPHDGYVGWDWAEAIRTMVSENVPTRSRGAPEFGAALPRCRRCGSKLSVRHAGAEGRIPCYVCVRGRIDDGAPNGIAFGGLRVDDVVEVVHTPDGETFASAT